VLGARQTIGASGGTGKGAAGPKLANCDRFLFGRLRTPGRDYDPAVRRTPLFLAAGVCLLVAVVLAALRVGEEPGSLSGRQALVLGVVQGLTELLPISSSGHLILVPWIADWEFLRTHEAFNKTFDVSLHLGTLVAVIAYFWTDVVTLVAAWLRSVRRRSIRTDDERVAWLVAVATVPAAVVGAAGESFIEDHLGDPWQIAIFLAAFGVVLWWVDRVSRQDRSMHELGWRRGVVVGLAQTLALAPGVSRSGITITAGRLYGLSRDAAARLSFLLLIPVVFGAALLKGVKDVLLGDLPAGWQGPFLIGTIAAAGSGLVAIWALLGYVRRHDYSAFAVYRLAVAAVVVLLIAAGARDATF
jgi:undecaprenyl-diphosphatase